MTYSTMEEAYKAEFSRLVSSAKTLLINKDYAIDCVHDAFEKVLLYVSKRPGSRINGFLLLREVSRAAKKYNRDLGLSMVEHKEEPHASDDTE
jgi:DNA-directed RNA polymerase specialized sigma24 family protein